jgi:protein-S-isoprenylcysteine O-methyltransferase Ste14
MYLRLEVWNGGWPIWVPPVITVVAIVLFVIYAIDEDKEALEYSRRPYNTQTLDKAYPGSRRE